MGEKAEQHLKAILELSDQLDAVAQSGFSTFEEDGFLLLNGIVRECAYRLRAAVEAGRKAHLGGEGCGSHAGAMPA